MAIDPKDREYYLLGLRIAADFGATIAVPVIIFVFIGQWLDGKYETGYWFTAGGFVLAAFVSAKIIFKKAREYGKEYNALNKKDAKADRSTCELTHVAEESDTTD